MSKVLSINAGSSSLKFQLLEMPEAEVTMERKTQMFLIFLTTK